MIKSKRKKLKISERKSDKNENYIRKDAFIESKV